MQSAILIVEDEALLAKNMQRYLSKLGYEVRIASSTRDAIIAVNNFHPDVVVIDYQLPDGSGLELLRQLKEKNVAAHTIFMTGHGSIQIAVDAMKAGAAEFITKPLVLEELGLTIE
jgi:DNA-binding NtrC family response regulator